MDFRLTKEQELLRDGLGRFLATRYDLESSRTAAKTGPGWRPEIWRSFAEELGILAAPLPESAGGIGGGPVEVMVIAEELGRALVVEPYIDVVVVSGGLLQRSPSARAAEVLTALGEGDAIVALAAGEPADGDRWEEPSTTAERDGADWVITGAKTVVIAAPLATHLLITARTEDTTGESPRTALFLTEFDAADPPPGVEMHPYRTIDDRRAADLVFTGLRVPAESLIDEDARPSLLLAHDQGAAAVCAEAVGAMRTVLADTVAYCKQRQQFGQPIGGFQVLQHRMVDMYMELEQSVAAAYLATLRLDAEPAVRARAVSAAKATVGRAARFVGQNAVQLHGGMGMTEELAVGHYFRRLTALQYEFGSTDAHRTRYAQLTRG
ncbi:MAG TPA: acyl-CoA dehydrogenase family protein [Mycobacterium sp.]|nr:acyl-CoA dehydrogenase family protein [Mycobacterium sp.]